MNDSETIRLSENFCLKIKACFQVMYFQLVFKEKQIPVDSFFPQGFI